MADMPIVTDEDRAIARRWLQEGQINVDHMGRAGVLVAIRQEFSAALAAEREEIVGVIEHESQFFDKAGKLAARRIAYVIRARGEK